MAAPEVSPFYNAVAAVFKGWTALQLAVAHSFGGSQSKEKAEWLIGATEQWFQENSDIDSFELEEFLSEIMSSEFSSIVDDNSLAEVSTKICRLYDLAKQGKFEELNSAIEKLSKSAAVSSCQHGQDDSDDDGMNIEDGNVMNHMNALELNGNHAGVHATVSDTNNDNESQGGDNSVEDTPMEEGDGWTKVTKGGRRKRGG